MERFLVGLKIHTSFLMSLIYHFARLNLESLSKIIRGISFFDMVLTSNIFAML